jgi:glycosyltransferase involved in cell wall biosynthesis
MIDVYLLCFNEEKFLQFAINHYKKWLPNANIIVYDNMSTDGSDQILRNNGCQIRKFDTGNAFDDKRHMDIKNSCWKEQSKNDWVLVADLDELPFVSEEDLKIETAKGTSIFSFEGYTLVGGRTGYDLEGLKKGHRDGGHDKKHIFNRRMIKEMNYDAGAHNCSPQGRVKYSDRKYKTVHYKWISLEAVADRHAFYANRMSETNKKNGWGIQYYWTPERLTEVYESLLPSLGEVL